VTENFTGKEHDDEIALNYFGARYLDPMLGMWISVDPARQFASPYLYMGNGTNPIILTDTDGNVVPLVILGAFAKGAALGIGIGVGLTYVDAVRNHHSFHYSLADGITDGVVGVFGLGAIKNGWAAGKGILGLIKTIGKPLHRNKWKNRHEAAKISLEKGIGLGASGKIVDEFLPKMIEDYKPSMKEHSIDYEIPTCNYEPPKEPVPEASSSTALNEE